MIFLFFLAPEEVSWLPQSLSSTLRYLSFGHQQEIRNFHHIIIIIVVDSTYLYNPVVMNS